MASHRIGARVAGLSPAQLCAIIEAQAGASDAALRVADEHAARLVEQPEWVLSEVLLSPDLAPHILAQLPTKERAVKGTCRAWRRGWKETLKKRERPRLVVFCGRDENNDGEFLSSLERYDASTNAWEEEAVAPMPSARTYVGTAVLDGKLYAAGGRNEADGATSSSVERFDLATKSWEAVAPMVTPRENHAVAVLDGKLYAVGGYDDDQFLSSVERYDPAATAYIHYESTKRLPKFLDRHYNSIKNFTPIGRKQYRIECYKALNETFNRIHCASEVLSMSKTIMNEPFVLAEDLGILITYQDTDSMHISAKKLDELAAGFRQKYGRELVGKGIGQFHTDFDFKQCFAVKNGKLGLNTARSVGKIIATESIIVAKKTYLDVLEDEAGSVAYHVRGKGVSHRVLVDTVNERFGGDLAQMYHDLYDGDAVDFDFSINKNIVFKRKRDHRTYTSDLVRRIRFPVES